MLAESFAELGLARPERAALEFMRAHASLVVVVPDAATVERLALERQIVLSLNADGARARTVTRLAQLHGTGKRFISKTYKQGNGQGIAATRRDEQDRSMPCRFPRLSRFAVRCRV